MYFLYVHHILDEAGKRSVISGELPTNRTALVHENASEHESGEAGKRIPDRRVQCNLTSRNNGSHQVMT